MELNLETRTVSQLEREYLEEIEKLENEIRETKRQKRQKILALEERRKEQQKRTLEMGEEKVTPEKIRHLTIKYDQQIRVMEKKVQALRQSSGNVVKTAQQQKDLFTGNGECF